MSSINHQSFFFAEKVYSILVSLTKLRCDTRCFDGRRLLSNDDIYRMLKWCSSEILLLNLLESRQLMTEYAACVYMVMRRMQVDDGIDSD